jgi:hypothetical protein
MRTVYIVSKKNEISKLTLYIFSSERQIDIPQDIQNFYSIVRACHQLSECENCGRFFPERSKLEE